MVSTEERRGVIICYDTTNPESFRNAKTWKGEADLHSFRYTSYILVGTKSDLPSAVDPAAAREYADSINAPLMMCSAKTGDGVSEIFEWVTEDILFRML